jgi:hypothetical protein
MASIFELVQSQELTAYWDSLSKDKPPYLGEELFPSSKKLGLDLKWIKGAKGLPAVLNPSAFDAAAMKRDRIGFDKLQAQMPFFKESMYVDEELRQELNMVLETGNQAYIDSVTNRVFDDEMGMLEGAAAQRERMRMMALTTGAIAIAANGQNYAYDYGVAANQKKSAAVVWSNTSADIVTEIREWQDEIEDTTGVRPTRAVCSRKTWGYLTKNIAIRNAILGNNTAVSVSDDKVKKYLLDELELEIVIYTKRFLDETKTATKFVPDDTFVLFPEGALGTGWFGTTPEESDLTSNSAANVSITDTGVAVTTVKKTDPVNVDTKVTMVYLPSFEQADKIIIADVA